MRPVASYCYWTTAVVLIAAAALACDTLAQKEKASSRKDPFASHDVREQATQFMDDYRSIRLTPEQEAIKQEALSAIPAPCCREYSIATCCCPCNLARSVWGLSHYLIAERGYDAGQLRQAVQEWLRSANPDGYAGDACDRGRCGMPFDHDGCGGMDEDRLS